MFGKLQSYGHRAIGIMKGGLGHAQNMYDKALHLGGEISSVWNSAKQVGRIVAPYLDKKFELGAGSRWEQGVDWGEGLKHQVIKRHADVLDEIGELGRVQSQVAAAVGRPHVGAYTGY